MESACCEVPAGLRDAGWECASLLRVLCESVLDRTLRAQLEALRKQHAATLYSALDYHSLGDLDEHDMQARKTYAVLGACAPDIVAAGGRAEVVASLRASLARASQLCTVSPSSAPPAPTVQAWAELVKRFLRT